MNYCGSLGDEKLREKQKIEACLMKFQRAALYSLECFVSRFGLRIGGFWSAGTEESTAINKQGTNT